MTTQSEGPRYRHIMGDDEQSLAGGYRYTISPTQNRESIFAGLPQFAATREGETFIGAATYPIYLRAVLVMLASKAT